MLVPGPKKEIELVQEIFRMFVKRKLSIPQIARELNRRGLRQINGAEWKQGVLRTMLTNLKYTGCQVFGRTTQKLSTPVVRVPKEQWTIKPGAFEAIIDQKTFDKAQARFKSYPVNLSNDELLQRLKRLLAKKGKLSVSIIQRSRLVPSPSVYARRFGSLAQAYELIGYNAPENFSQPGELKRRTNAVRERILKQLEALYPGYVTVVGRGTRFKPHLQVRNFTVTVQVARAKRTKNLGIQKWLVDPGKMESERSSICLLVRLTPANNDVRDLYLLPRLKQTGRFGLREDDEGLRNAVRLNKLEDFYAAVERLHSLRQAMGRTAPDRFF